MRGRLLLPALALFLLTLNAASRQTAGSPSATGEVTTPGEALSPDGDNQRLGEQILHVLQGYPSLAGSSFSVNVSDTQIELGGSVPTAREKEIARRIAQSYGNNRSVLDAKVSVRNAGGTQNVQTPPR
jgi:hypothetical protein